MTHFYYYYLQPVKTGALLDQESEVAEIIIKHATEYAKQNVRYDSDQPQLKIEAEVKSVEPGNEFNVAKTLCDLLKVSLVHLKLCNYCIKGNSCQFEA